MPLVVLPVLNLVPFGVKRVAHAAVPLQEIALTLGDERRADFPFVGARVAEEAYGLGHFLTYAVSQLVVAKREIRRLAARIGEHLRPAEGRRQ